MSGVNGAGILDSKVLLLCGLCKQDLRGKSYFLTKEGEPICPKAALAFGVTRDVENVCYYPEEAIAFFESLKKEDV